MLGVLGVSMLWGTSLAYCTTSSTGEYNVIKWVGFVLKSFCMAFSDLSSSNTFRTSAICLFILLTSTVTPSPVLCHDTFSPLFMRTWNYRLQVNFLSCMIVIGRTWFFSHSREMIGRRPKIAKYGKLSIS